MRRSTRRRVRVPAAARLVDINSPRSLSVGLATLDRRLRFLHVNPALARISGKPAASHLGRPVGKILPFIAPALEPLLQRAIRTGRRVCDSKVSGRRRNRAGGSDDWLVSCIPRVEAPGEVPQVELIVQAATERRQVDSCRRENEERFRILAESTPVMIWQAGPDKRCTYFNQRWLEFTGRPMEQQLGEGWVESVHPEDRQRCMDSYARAFDAREPFTLEYRLRRFDQEYRWVLDSGVAWHDMEGRFAGYLGSCIDITERKCAEEALQRSEDFSRGVLMSLREHIAIIDPDGKILAANETWEHFAETEGASNLIGVAKGFNYLDICRRSALGGDETAQAALEGIQAVLNGSRGDFSIEYRVDSAAGSRWFLMDVVPLRRASGGAVISHTNITDQKRAQFEAQENRIELDQMRRVSTIGELAASIAHELNQPLTAILSNAQAALRFLNLETPDLNEVRDILKDVVLADKRAGEVIRRLRVLLKKQELELGPLQINDVVNSVAEMLHSDAILRKASILLDLDSDLPLTYGDDVQLQQVLLNLVLNALDAMAETPPERKIVSIHTGRDGNDGLRVSVKDLGHGLSKQNLARIFTPFFTTKKEGLGMGLAVAHSIIEAHKGRLWAESNPDGGTAFHFTLPVHRSDPDPRTTA